MAITKQEMIDEIKNHKEIKKLIKENSLLDEDIEKNAVIFYSYILNINKCAGCNGKSCIQDVTGYMPCIKYYSQAVLDFEPCKYAKELLNNRKIKNNLTCLCCNIDEIDSQTIWNKPARKDLYSKCEEVYNNYFNNGFSKGLYVHGSYGTGKTYVLACLAKKFANNGKDVIFAYYPDLVRKIKSSIANGDIEDIIDDLKEVDVLFLDDFGGETVTAFIRDEVLGPILQDRMVNKRLTFMSSNLDEKTLHLHLSETQKEYDDVKASRVEERIKVLMEFINLKDLNYRS